MRIITVLAFSFLISIGSIFGQNQAPVISNLTVNHSPGTQSVTINYDLADNESDPVEMLLSVSGDGGRTWLVTLQTSVTGDIGYPVTPGTGKSITWNYSVPSLVADGLTGPVSLDLRLVADDRVGIDIQEIVDQVDSTRLVETLRFIEGARHRQVNVAHLQEVQDSIRDLMAASGLQDWHHQFNYGSYLAQNYIGRIAGLSSERRTWYVTGHYDSVSNSPGADDNGSATAAVMEVVRILSAYGFRNSIRFCAFDLEEAGLVGSTRYVNNRIPDWEEVAGQLNMEMIGYKDNAVNSQALPTGFNILFPAAYNAVASDSFRGNFLTNVANVASDSLRIAFDSCAAAYVPGLRVVSLAAPGNAAQAPDLRRSDHAPFWDAGYRALMLTDAADLRNLNYHTPADSVGTLDLGFFVQNVKAVIATLAKLASPMHATTASDTIQVNLPVGLSDSRPSIPLSVFPNPSDNAFNIEFALDHPQQVKILVLDEQGRIVRKLADRTWEVGSHRLTWDGTLAGNGMASSGNYWVELLTEKGRQVQAIRLLK